MRSRACVIARIVRPEHGGEPLLGGGFDHLLVVISARRAAEVHALADCVLDNVVAGLILGSHLIQRDLG